jgi:hypothetical protein
MNSLAILLMATAAAGADPQPIAPVTASPFGSYTYTEPAPESRPSLFGRFRNALSSKSSTTSSGTVSSPAYQVTGTGTSAAPRVISTETAIPSARRIAPSGSSTEPPLADAVPVTTPAAPVTARPVTPPTFVTQPTYTYPAPATTPAPESSRPRHFPRLHKLFGGSSSKSNQALPEDAIVTQQVVTPSAPVSAVPVIQGQPQRMPLGNP